MQCYTENYYVYINISLYYVYLHQIEIFVTLFIIHQNYALLNLLLKTRQARTGSTN